MQWVHRASGATAVIFTHSSARVPDIAWAPSVHLPLPNNISPYYFVKNCQSRQKRFPPSFVVLSIDLKNVTLDAVCCHQKNKRMQLDEHLYEYQLLCPLPVRSSLPCKFSVHCLHKPSEIHVEIMSFSGEIVFNCWATGWTSIVETMSLAPGNIRVSCLYVVLCFCGFVFLAIHWETW